MKPSGTREENVQLRWSAEKCSLKPGESPRRAPTTLPKINGVTQRARRGGTGTACAAVGGGASAAPPETWAAVTIYTRTACPPRGLGAGRGRHSPPPQAWHVPGAHSSARAPRPGNHMPPPVLGQIKLDTGRSGRRAALTVHVQEAHCARRMHLRSAPGGRSQTGKTWRGVTQEACRRATLDRAPVRACAGVRADRPQGGGAREPSGFGVHMYDVSVWPAHPEHALGRHASAAFPAGQRLVPTAEAASQEQAHPQDGTPDCWRPPAGGPCLTGPLQCGRQAKGLQTPCLRLRKRWAVWGTGGRSGQPAAHVPGVVAQRPPPLAFAARTPWVHSKQRPLPRQRFPRGLSATQHHRTLGFQFSKWATRPRLLPQSDTRAPRLWVPGVPGRQGVAGGAGEGADPPPPLTGS